MLFNFGFHSSVLLIFFVHGLLFTVLLSWKASRQNDRASGWLAAFTFVCTLNILPWMLGHAGWYFSQPYRNILFYVPCQHFLLLGPLIYCYTRQLLNPGFRFDRRQLIHFLPAVLYIIYSAFMFVADRLVLGEPYFYADGRDRDLDNWYRLLGILSLSGYLLLSLRYYNIYRKLTVHLTSDADGVLFRWIRRYLTALLLMQAFDLLFFALYPGWGSFPAKWWYYFIFSILFYYVAFMGYTQPARSLFSFRLTRNRDQVLVLQTASNTTSRFQDLLPPVVDEALIETGTPEQTVPAAIDDEILLLKTILIQKLEKEEWFREPELTLAVVAKRLQTNASIVSKVVNRGTGMSFNDFINSYRVEAVKQALKNGGHHQQTLLGIALDCGFNSKTSFNRVFKRHTGLSPREFVEQQQRQTENASTPQENESPDHDLERPAPHDLPNSPQILPS